MLFPCLQVSFEYQHHLLYVHLIQILFWTVALTSCWTGFTAFLFRFQSICCWRLWATPRSWSRRSGPWSGAARCSPCLSSSLASSNWTPVNNWWEWSWLVSQRNKKSHQTTSHLYIFIFSPHSSFMLTSHSPLHQTRTLESFLMWVLTVTYI